MKILTNTLARLEVQNTAYLALGRLVGADVGGPQYLQPSQLTPHHHRLVELALDVVETLRLLGHVEADAEGIEHLVHVPACARWQRCVSVRNNGPFRRLISREIP